MNVRGKYRAQAWFRLAWLLYRCGLPLATCRKILAHGLNGVRISLNGSPWMRPYYTQDDLDRQLTK